MAKKYEAAIGDAFAAVIASSSTPKTTVEEKQQEREKEMAAVAAVVEQQEKKALQARPSIRETKSAKINLLMYPSLVKAAKKKAEKLQISFNEYINNLVKEDLK